MKRILNLLLFTLLASAAIAQQKPDYQQTRTAQVLDEYSKRFTKSLTLPAGPTPGFPAWVSDTSKCGSIFIKTGGVKDTLMIYDCTMNAWKAIASYDDNLLLRANNPTFTGYLSGKNINITQTTSTDSSGIYFPFESDYLKIFMSRNGVSDMSRANFIVGDNKTGDSFYFGLDTAAMVGITKKIVPLLKLNLDSLQAFSTNSYFKNIYQNGNQVANDNSVIHTTGNEAWTGDKRSHGFFTTEVLGLGDGTTNVSTGNSFNIIQNSAYNRMAWVVPNTNIGPAITFLKNGSNTLKFQLYTDGADGNGGIFDFNGTLRAENTPVAATDVVRLTDLDTLISRQLTTYNPNGLDTISHYQLPIYIEGHVISGSKNYAVTNDAIYTFNATTHAVIDSNKTPFTGITGVNHFGQPTIIGNSLITPVETYIVPRYFANPKMVFYNKNTLAMTKQIDLSAYGEQTAYTTDGTYIYNVSYLVDNVIQKLDTAGTLVSTLTMDYNIRYMQGIAYNAGSFYISDRSGNIFNVTPTGHVTLVFSFLGKVINQEYEGLYLNGSTLEYSVRHYGSKTTPSLAYIYLLNAPVGLKQKTMQVDANGDQWVARHLSVGIPSASNPANPTIESNTSTGVVFDGFNTAANDNSKSHLYLYTGKNGSIWSQNAYYDYTWLRNDTTKTSFALSENQDSNSYLFRIALHSNKDSIGTWLQPMAVDTGGIQMINPLHAQRAATIGWLNNSFGIKSYPTSGTTIDPISLSVTNGTLTNSYKINYSGTPKHVWTVSSSSAGQLGYDFGGSFTQSSGLSFVSAISPTINQTSTAGFIANGTYPYLQGIGSGTKYLWGVGTSTAPDMTGTLTHYLTVTNTGVTTIANTLGIGNAPRQQLSVGANLDLYSGSENSATMPSIRATSANLYLNSFGTSGDVYISADHGSGKVHVGSSANNDRIILDGSTAGGGTITSSGGIISGAAVRFKGYTVATLPTGTTGDNAYVTDAVSPTYLGALTGGGSITVPVFYNGTAWVSH